jgi:hypothetical protein
MSIENIIQSIIDAKEEIPTDLCSAGEVRGVGYPSENYDLLDGYGVDTLNDLLIDIKEKLDDVVDDLRELDE